MILAVLLESSLPLSLAVQCLCSVMHNIPFLSPNIKVRGKGHSRTGHKGPERE